MLAINEILQERYRIIRQLGQGGMGAIYVAEDVKRFGKLVALKEILVDLDKLPDQKQRDLFRRAFEREAKILTQLEHEAFPQVVDYFLETDRQFLVMELIQGEDLYELLENDKTPFSLEEVLNWTQQLLDALDYLHTLTPPVIHRDIKPQNLKVTTRGKVKLLDFGIATGSNAQFQTTITNHTFIAATRHYSPLEQIVKVIDPGYRKLLQQNFGERLLEIIESKSDASSDIYALGATLYHLLTARLPVDALKRTLEVWDGNPDPLIDPHKINSQIPQEISHWLLKAMAIERKDRFASAAEMQRALRERIFLEEEARRIEEQENLKRERELIEQERQKFEAERLAHWRQIDEEQKRQAAEREAQRQIVGQDDWKAQNQETSETQSLFPPPAITQLSPEVSVSSNNKNSEIEIPVDETKAKDTSPNFTEHSYLPENFHENKKTEANTKSKTSKIENTLVSSIKAKKKKTKFSPISAVVENLYLLDTYIEKKAAWVLPFSAVGLLLIVGTVLSIWFLSGKSDNSNTNTYIIKNTSALPTSVDSNQVSTNTTPEAQNIPTSNTVLFQNSKENLKDDLARNFRGFSFYYPNDWVNTQSSTNFADVAQISATGTPIEQFLVSYYDSKGTFAADLETFPALAEQSAQDLEKSLNDKFNLISQGETKLKGKWEAYEMKFQGEGVTKNGDRITLWGKRLWLPADRNGVRTGFVLTLLATSLSQEVKSADDVGVKGELASVLETFEPTLTVSSTQPTPNNQPLSRPTPQPQTSRSQPTKTAKPKSSEDPNCVFTNSCQ